MPQPRKSDNLIALAGGKVQPNKRTADLPGDFEAGRPPVPAHLSPDEKKLFRRFRSMLAARGTLTKLDGLALEILTTQYTRLRLAQAELSKGLFVDQPVPDGNGGFVYRTVANPAVSMVEKCEGLIRAQLMQLGLTPGTRRPQQFTKQGKQKSVGPREGSFAAKLLEMKNADANE